MSHRGEPSPGRTLASWIFVILVYVVAATVIAVCMVKLSA